MAGLMLHLLMAHKIKPDAGILFYAGSIAPDAVSYWKEKDVTHFRNLKDRGEALANLALNTDPSDDFAEGVLLHLYMDWRWDILARDEFIKNSDGEWLINYRKELSLSSSYAFHHTDWAKDIWERMANLDISEYGKTPGATNEEVNDFICRNYKWHIENNTEPSAFFTPEFVEGFINKIADEYTEWKTQREIEYYRNKLTKA